MVQAAASTSSGAEARITKSTLNANVAHGSGGGLFQSGSDLFVVNTTITRNRADATGGGVQSSEAGGQVNLNSVTVARNLANLSHRSALGGGLSVKGGSFGVVNSIIALNRAAAKPSECHGELDSFGGNLLGTMAGCRGFLGSDLVASNPMLGPLRDNGGPTETLALRSGQPGDRQGKGASKADGRPARPQAHRAAGHRRLRAFSVAARRPPDRVCGPGAA